MFQLTWWRTAVRPVSYRLGLRAQAPKRNVLVGLLYLLLASASLNAITVLL